MHGISLEVHKSWTIDIFVYYLLFYIYTLIKTIGNPISMCIRSKLTLPIGLLAYFLFPAVGIAQDNPNQSLIDDNKRSLQQERDRRKEIESAKKESTAGQKRAERSARSLQHIRHTYHQARQLFGDDHVILTGSIYVGQRPCEKGPCKLNLGIAGAIMPVLVAGGGNRKTEFFPSIETSEEAETYVYFERRARKLSEIMINTATLTEQDSPFTNEIDEEHYQLMAAAFEDILQRHMESSGMELEFVESLLACLHELNAAPDFPKHKIAQLDMLWRQYELLFDKSEEIRRHAWLVGAGVAFPFTDGIEKEIMSGLLLEAQLFDGFRLTFIGGARHLYMNFAPKKWGWWVGIALNGEVVESIFDGIHGASQWAASMKVNN